MNFLFTQKMQNCIKQGFDFSNYSKTASYEIENLWLANRITPNDKIVNHVIITLVQKRGVNAYIDTNGEFKIKNFYQPAKGKLNNDGFIFRGGCTLIFDLDTMKLKYVIKKDINDEKRMEQQFKYSKGMFEGEEASTYFDDKTLAGLSGPFAFMHSQHH